jgi:hypothetical protein
MNKTVTRGTVSSGNFVQVGLRTERLENFLAVLQERYITRVGILGNKQDRSKAISNKRKTGRRPGNTPESMTNAEIGLIMEKGSLSMRIPRRSFLEMPLILKSNELSKAKRNILDAFQEDKVKSESAVREAYKKLGMIAENIIQRAFTSSGYGRWAPNKPSTIRRKHSSMPLIDTAQLRKSITSDVVKK